MPGGWAWERNSWDQEEGIWRLSGQSRREGGYVLDTWAFTALFQDEDGADTVWSSPGKAHEALLDAVLVHQDPDFEGLGAIGKLEMLELPYNKS